MQYMKKETFWLVNCYYFVMHHQMFFLKHSFSDSEVKVLIWWCGVLYAVCVPVAGG